MIERFSISCELNYSVGFPSEFMFNVQAAKVPQQRILSESLTLTGACDIQEHMQLVSGNRFVRARADAGIVQLRYLTRLEVDYVIRPRGDIREVAVGKLPFEVLPFVLPSRYCESDRLIQLAQSRFGHLPPGYSRVESVCEWIHQHVRFRPGTTSSCTSATDVLIQGTGVCRDFAHLTIAFLRALNIPARFVTGYDYGVDPSYGPTDFHAYVEAFLDDRWWIFDASRLCPRNGLVRIGTGRDAADVAFATIFGNIRFDGMKLDIQPIDANIVDPIDSALSSATLDNADEGAAGVVSSEAGAFV